MLAGFFWLSTLDPGLSTLSMRHGSTQRVLDQDAVTTRVTVSGTKAFVDRYDLRAGIDVERQHRVEQASIIVAAPYILLDRNVNMLSVPSRSGEADNPADAGQTAGEIPLKIDKLPTQPPAAEPRHNAHADQLIDLAIGRVRAGEAVVIGQRLITRLIVSQKLFRDALSRCAANNPVVKDGSQLPV